MKKLFVLVFLLIAVQLFAQNTIRSSTGRFRFINTTTGDTVTWVVQDSLIKILGPTYVFKLDSMTTTERNSLNAQPGMLIYNETDGEVQGYTGTWVDATSSSANATQIRGIDITQISPTDNQILVYDSASDSLKYEAQTGGSGGAPLDASYIVVSLNGDLTTERKLTGTSNQITFSDGGANGNLTLSLPQNYHTTATPQLGRLGLGTAADNDAEFMVVTDGDTFRIDFGTALQIIDAEINDTKVFQVDSSGNIFSNALTASRLVTSNANNILSSSITEANLESSISDVTNLIHAGEIDTYSELNAITADVTLTHNGFIDTYSELNTIVADQTLTHNGLIDTYAELNTIVSDKTLVNIDDNFDISGIYRILDDTEFRFGSSSEWAFEYDNGVDDQLLLKTTNTAATAITDPLFEILVGTTPTANQQVFGVAKGTQSSNTPLFTLDEDGDIVTVGTLDATTITASTAFSGPNVTSGADPGHTHTGSSISGLGNADIDEIKSYWADSTGSDGFVTNNTITSVETELSVAGTPAYITVSDHEITRLAIRSVWVDSVGNDGLLTQTQAINYVSKVGTPADNQIGVWTGDGTIEGSNGLKWITDYFAVSSDGDSFKVALYKQFFGIEYEIANTRIAAFDTVGSFWLRERASAGTDFSGLGQFWVKNETPNTPYFTDDAGNDGEILTSYNHVAGTDYPALNHATQHQAGGSDELDLTDMQGTRVKLDTLFAADSNQVVIAEDLKIDSTLFVSDKIGVQSEPHANTIVHISVGTSGATPSSGTELTIEDALDAKIHFLTPNTQSQAIFFSDPEGHSGYNRYWHNGDSLGFATSGSQRLTILSDGTIKLLGYPTDGFVKTTGGSGLITIDENSYLTGNETITLSGDVSGSGATSISTDIDETVFQDGGTDELDLTDMQGARILADTVRGISATQGNFVVDDTLRADSAVVFTRLTASRLLALDANKIAVNTITGDNLNTSISDENSVFESRTLTVSGTTNEITSSAGAQDLSANRTWTLSLPSALIFTGKTITGGIYSAPVLDLPEINDTSDDHQYIFAVNELAADRTVTLPLLTGNDTFVFNDFAATLTNKTIVLGSNTVSGTSAEFDAANTDGNFAFSGGAFHDGFSDFVANEHVDHTGVTLTAGDGLSGGGDISANRTFTVNVHPDSAILITNDSLRINVDDATINIASNQLQVKDSGINLATKVTGTLPVANGGTGTTTLTDGGVLLGSGTGAITPMAVLADGEFIVGDGTTDPVAESGRIARISMGVDIPNLTQDTPTIGDSIGFWDITGDDFNRAALSDVEAILTLSNQLGQVSDTQIADGAVDGGLGGEIADNTVDNNDLVEIKSTWVDSGATDGLVTHTQFDSVFISASVDSIQAATQDTIWFATHWRNTVTLYEIWLSVDSGTDASFTFVEADETGGNVQTLGSVTTSSSGANLNFGNNTSLSHTAFESEHNFGIVKPSNATLRFSFKAAGVQSF